MQPQTAEASKRRAYALSPALTLVMAQEEMDELHSLLAALPARRVAADAKRNAWWAFGAFLVVVVGPILVLSLLPVGIWIDVAAFLGVCALAAVCWFVGVLRGIVVVPTLDDDDIEDKTRKRAQQTLKVMFISVKVGNYNSARGWCVVFELFDVCVQQTSFGANL